MYQITKLSRCSLKKDFLFDSLLSYLTYKMNFLVIMLLLEHYKVVKSLWLLFFGQHEACYLIFLQVVFTVEINHINTAFTQR